MAYEDDLFQQAEDDLKTVAFIRNYLPQDCKEKFSDDDLMYCIDVLADYYVESGILDAEPNNEGFVDIDTEAVAAYLAKQAQKDQMGPWTEEELLWVVQGELEFGEQD